MGSFAPLFWEALVRIVKQMDEATRKLQEIYPDLKPGELEEVRDFFKRYLRLVIEIYSYSKANDSESVRQD